MNALCGETVRTGRLNTSVLDFLCEGHSKTKTDKLFANAAIALASKDYFNILYENKQLSEY